MINKQIHLSVLFSIILSGCGGSSDTSEQGTEIVLGDGYDEKPGDVFTTSSTVNAVYSNGQTAEIISTDVKTYTQVNEIPAKYGYSNSISGPYLLETTQEDGVLDGLEYMTQSGDFIIDDDLDYFSSIEFTTQSGSEEPENIHIGDQFSFIQNSTLFDSHSGVEAGFEITNIDFSVLKQEQVAVSAGSFNAVKISYSISSTKSENNIVDTSSGTGHGWFDTTNGFMLKLVINDGNMTLNEHNLTASFSAETVLQGYSISQNRSRKNSQINPVNKVSLFIGVKPYFIFQNLKYRFQYIQ